MITWTAGDVSGLQVLVDAPAPTGDHLYASHINELRAQAQIPLKSVYNAYYVATDYGITGDGTTDDAPAIQALLDSIVSSPQAGAEIFFPKGIYKIGTTISITKAGIHIRGASPSAVIFSLKNNVNGDVFYANGTSFGALQHFYLSNFSIAGNSANQTTGNGIHTNNFQMCRFQNVFVDDVKVDGIYMENSSHYSVLLDNFVSSCGRDAYVVYNNPDTFMFIGNYAFYPVRYGFRTDSGSTYTEFLGNSVIAAGEHGMYIGSAHTNIVGNRILGASHTTTNTHSGVYILNSQYVKVVGNTFNSEVANQPKYWVEESGTADFNIIEGNSMTMAATASILTIGASTQIGVNYEENSPVGSKFINQVRMSNATFNATFGSYDVSRNALLVGERTSGWSSVQVSSTANNSTYPNYGLVMVNGNNTSNYDVWGIMHDGPLNSTGGLKIAFANGSTGGVDIISTTPVVTFQKSGNVGIGTAVPNASALLDLTSTTKAFMPPRMTGTQRDAIGTPASGMVVYNTTTNKLNVFGSAAWEAVTSS